MVKSVRYNITLIDSLHTTTTSTTTNTTTTTTTNTVTSTTTFENTTLTTLTPTIITTTSTDNHDVISLDTFSTAEAMEKAISDKEIAIGGGRAGDKLKPLFEPAPQGMVLAERLTRYLML